MTEKFNIKNIFLNSVEKTETKQVDKNNDENKIVRQENIFDGSKNDTVDNNKILEDSEKYTKEKYGSAGYTENIDNFEDYTDLCEDLIEDENASETNVNYDKPKPSSETNKTLKVQSSFYTDNDGNKVEVRTYKDDSGTVQKTQTYTTKVITSGNPYRETVCTETDKNGTLNFESKFIENFTSGTKIYKERDNNGNTNEICRDRDGNIISTKSETVDGPTIHTIETDKDGNRTVTNFTRNPDGSILENKTVIAANGTILYYSEVNKDISTGNIEEYILKNDENGNPVYERKLESDLNGIVKFSEETETTFDENGNTVLKNQRHDTDGRIIKSETVYTQNATCLSFSSIIEDPENDSIYERVINYDENGRTSHIQDLDTDLKGNIKSSDETEYKYDENGNTFIKHQSNQSDGRIVKDESVVTQDSICLSSSTTIEDPKNNSIYEHIIKNDENGKRSYELQTEKYSNGNVKSFEEITYFSHVVDAGNTAYPVSETKSVHINSDGDNYIATETKNLRTGEVSLKEIHEDGIITKVTDKDGAFISQTVFKPEESYADLFAGKLPEELIKLEKEIEGNKTGDYIVLENSGKAEITSSVYHIDSTGKRTDYSEADKVQIMLQYQGLNENIETSYQSSTGDCWLLSGVNSLSYSEKGREIIEDALEYNEDGATVHTYFGDYSFSYEEIEASTRELYSYEEDGRIGKKYAEGDPDVVVFEMAIEQLRSDIAEGIYVVKYDNFIKGWTGKVTPEEISIEGGYQSELIYYLTGNQSTPYYDEKEKKEVLSTYMENYDTAALNVAVYNDVSVTDINGDSVTLVSPHAYSVKSYDGENVTIVNPWNSDKDIVISADDLVKYAELFQYTDLSTIEKDNGLFDNKNDMFWFTFIANAMSKFNNF